MLQLPLNGLTRILCLGAHSDDIEIGCGGTILHLLESKPDIEVYWLIFCCADLQRATEARRSANSFLKKAKVKTIDIRSFRDGFLPHAGPPIKECFEDLKKIFNPDLIFTHFRHDLHQDHRTICELTWNTFRRHAIFEYEIPKYDGDLQSPNVFLPLTEGILRRKVRALTRHFASQRNKHWFTEDLFLSLPRIRGMEAASPTGYAEAFYCRKLLLGGAS